MCSFHCFRYGGFILLDKLFNLLKGAPGNVSNRIAFLN